MSCNRSLVSKLSAVFGAFLPVVLMLATVSCRAHADNSAAISAAPTAPASGVPASGASAAPAASPAPPASSSDSAAPSSTATPSAPATLTPSVANIPIGAYDVLHLDVLGQPDLTKDYTVDSNGDINVAYVGKIRVGGLTTDQAEGVVTDRLQKFYKNISLNLTRTAIGGISVTVTGQVSRTGPVSVRRDARLNDVIQTLGPTSDADLSKVQITRGLPGEEHTTLNADLASYLNNGTDAGNPLLKDGDVVFVPMKPVPVKPITMTVSVVGAVPRPGQFQVNPGTTVYDVVTMAGSLGMAADPKGLYVQPASATSAHVPLDWVKLANTPGDPALNPIVQDGDKIVVPEIMTVSTFSIIGGVRNPGAYPLHGNISMADALAMAGGLSEDANPKATKITRMSGTGTSATTTTMDLNDSTKIALFQIQPDDHIDVGVSHHTAGMTPIEILGAVVSIATIVSLLHL